MAGDCRRFAWHLVVTLLAHPKLFDITSRDSSINARMRSGKHLPFQDVTGFTMYSLYSSCSDHGGVVSVHIASEPQKLCSEKHVIDSFTAQQLHFPGRPSQNQDMIAGETCVGIRCSAMLTQG